MVPAGKVVCLAEAREIDETYLYIAQDKLVLGVAKNAFGSFKIYDINKQVEVELEKRPVTRNGLLVKANIRVKFPDGKTKSYIVNNENRICKTCYDNEKKLQFIPTTMGFEDTYIVGVLGRPSVGKSALIDSSTRAITVNEDSHIYLANKSAEEIARYAVTQLGTRKNLVRELKITDKKGNPEVELLVNDTPGEFLTMKKEDRGADYDYFTRYVDLCDGIIYVLEKGDSNTQNLNWMDFIPKNMPVAIVMSKLDELEAETEKNGGVYHHEEAPIVTNAYFRNRKKNKKLNINQIIENQLVDKYILRKLCPALQRIDSRRENVAYFAVSAGVPVGDDKTELDLTKGCNAYIPLVYMIKYWGLR